MIAGHRPGPWVPCTGRVAPLGAFVRGNGGDGRRTVRLTRPTRLAYSRPACSGSGASPRQSGSTETATPVRFHRKFTGR